MCLTTSAGSWATLACFLATISTGAECLPHYSAEQLAVFADLVLVAIEDEPKTLKIQEFWKGTWKEKSIRLDDLAEFPKAFSVLTDRGKKPSLQEQFVVFVNLRPNRHIEANGVFRIAANGQILGYKQIINPGRYYLQAQPVYATLQELHEQVDRGKKEAPKRQREAMRAVLDARDSATFQQKLHELERFAHVGDSNLIEFVGSFLGASPKRDNACIY